MPPGIWRNGKKDDRLRTALFFMLRSSDAGSLCKLRHPVRITRLQGPPPPPPHIILINHHLWLWLWLRLHLSSFFCHFWLNFQGQLRASLADAIRSRSALRSNPYCKGIFNLLKKWRPFFPIFTGDASVRSISRWWTSDPFYHARPGIWRQVCDADSVQILRRDEKKNLDCVCRAV